VTGLYHALDIFAYVYFQRTGGLTTLYASSRADVSSTGLVDVAARNRANCQPNKTRLVEIREKYGLEQSFKYAKRTVSFSRKGTARRRSVTNLPNQLFKGDFQLIDTEFQEQPNNADCSSAIEAPVTLSPFPQDVDASDFMFGISTTYERFTESSATLIGDWAFWLTNGAGRSNGGKMILVLIDANGEQLDSVRRILTGAGINADTVTADSGLPMATRYLSLIPTMYKHADARRKKWLVLCDDDTFFPNMHALKDRLAEYDDTREMYIGTLSEDVDAVRRHGSQAFGGAGVFLSLPTAERMSRHFEPCSSAESLKKADGQGDRLLHQCILQNSDTTLTVLPDLWQLDTFGDVSGFYESGTKPLSLHHYRSWHHATPGLYSQIAYVCGEDCTLQRFQTADNYIISGYSIAHYPAGITFDTHAMEGTFRAENDEGWNFDYKFGPQRKSLLKTGRKVSWELKDSYVQHDGCVLQTYVRRGNDTRWVDADGAPMDSSDGVIELVWGPSG
jgi:hypothetical protein